MAAVPTTLHSGPTVARAASAPAVEVGAEGCATHSSAENALAVTPAATHTMVSENNLVHITRFVFLVYLHLTYIFMNSSVGQAATPAGLAAPLAKLVRVESATTFRRALATAATAVVSPTSSQPINQPTRAVVSHLPFISLMITSMICRD